MSFADRVLKFYGSLSIRQRLPADIVVMNPYQDPVAYGLCEEFYRKYYNDNVIRTMIIGINPGRFGAGVTGIPFTDPVKLSQICGISNDLVKKTELSADFIHEMIKRYGGADKFFSSFYFNSVSPLGFVSGGKNLNYYDNRELVRALDGFIRESLAAQLNFGVNRDLAFCLGEGENYKFLLALNEEEKFFKEIRPLAHPRFIMQYKRRQLDVYMEKYLAELSRARP